MDNFIEWRLIVKKLKGELRESESLQFDQWLNSDYAHAEYFKKVEADWHNPQSPSDDKLDIKALIAEFDAYVKRQKWYHSKRKMAWVPPYLKYAAIVGFLIAAAIIVFGISKFSWENVQFVKSAKVEVSLSELSDLDVACLVLPDGRHMFLDTLSDGLFVVDHALHIKKRGHVISYIPQNNNPNNQKHGLFVPRGQTYQLKLADGSSVWVNSETQITYPAGLADNTRTCHLNGEAFFNVIPSPIPFVVHTERANVAVMGTSFNVCSYSSDHEFVASLIEGKVKVNSGDQQLFLNPHEEAVLSDKDSKLRLRPCAQSAQSWFSETIFFENEPLSSLVNRLSHVYGAEFSFENENLKNLHFTGYFEKSEGLNNLLDVIAMTSDVRFVMKRQGSSVHYLIQKTEQ